MKFELTSEFRGSEEQEAANKGRRTEPQTEFNRRMEKEIQEKEERKGQEKVPDTRRSLGKLSNSGLENRLKPKEVL